MIRPRRFGAAARVLPVDDGAAPVAPERASMLRELLGAGEEAATQLVEPGTIHLDRLVRSFLEGGDEDRLPGAAETGEEGHDAYAAHLHGFMLGLVPCASGAERKLAAEAAVALERSRSRGRSSGSLRRLVADGLVASGYRVCICRSKWNNSASMPAGMHEYIEVMLEGEGSVIVEIGFRSEFEIARATKAYRGLLQLLPPVFVGKAERLRQIVAVATEASRLSFMSKGLPVPPWRMFEYMKSKWLPPCVEQTSGVGAAAAGARLAFGSSVVHSFAL